jgi:hypothetical protein
MKTRQTILYGIFAVIFALAFTACGGDDDPGHTHTWGAWQSNATQHWKECSCGEEYGRANHTGDPCSDCSYSWTWTAVTDSTIWESANAYGDTYTASILAIAYGNGKFVAGGWDGKMAYSSDGASWTAVANSTIWDYTDSYGDTHTASIYGIAYGNNKWVAGGYDGKMAYSSDGITWTAVEDSTIWQFTITAIAYGNGKFVAVGSGGKMAYSSDGVTWTAVEDSTFGTSIITAIAYGNNRFVAVGDDGKMATSPDGITRTAVTNSTFGWYNINAIAYGNDKFVAGGSSGKMATSTDGISWTAVADSKFPATYTPNDNDESTYAINAITYGNNRFIAGGSIGKMAYSDNGVNWTAVADSTFGSSSFWDNINAIAYGNNKLVAGGYDGKMAYADW